MWVYQKTEAHLWSVGFFDPLGNWHTDSDLDDQGKAAARCNYLNGVPSEAVLPNEIKFSVKIPEDATKLIELGHNVIEALKRFQEGHP